MNYVLTNIYDASIDEDTLSKIDPICISVWEKVPDLNIKDIEDSDKKKRLVYALNTTAAIMASLTEYQSKMYMECYNIPSEERTKLNIELNLSENDNYSPMLILAYICKHELFAKPSQ